MKENNLPEEVLLSYIVIPKTKKRQNKRESKK
jgi:hypothetical protein